MSKQEPPTCQSRYIMHPGLEEMWKPDSLPLPFGREATKQFELNLATGQLAYVMEEGMQWPEVI